MKRVVVIIEIIILISTASQGQRLFPGLGAQRAGITSFSFLKIGVNPRAAAMGESFIAIADDASSLYWNPAGSVRVKTNELLFAHTLWFADIQHSFGAYLHKLSESDVIGVSAIALTMADMEQTTVIHPTGNGLFVSYRDLAVGLTYSRAMTDQFSFGITGKYVHETLAELTMQTFLIDLGAYYYTGYANSRFAFVLTNFGGTSKPRGSAEVYGRGTVSSFQEFSPPTLFRLSLAIEPWQTDQHRLTTSLQLNHPNDNAENLAIGSEYAWREMLYLRMGYKINVEEQRLPSFGIGLQVPITLSVVAFDYSVSPYGVLGTAHRFSLAVRL